MQEYVVVCKVVPVVAVTAPNVGVTIAAQELFAVQLGAAVHAPVVVHVITADADKE